MGGLVAAAGAGGGVGEVGKVAGDAYGAGRVGVAGEAVGDVICAQIAGVAAEKPQVAALGAGLTVALGAAGSDGGAWLADVGGV
jgi:hypothetical protein